MKLMITLTLLITLAAFATAQSGRRANLKHVNPPALSTPTGYTHNVEATGGRTVYVSGQIALDRNGNVVGAGDFRAQTRQVFENLKAALAASGATFEDVVKTTTFVTDLTEIAALREVRSGYYGPNPPASTLIKVSGLARPELMIEIEAIAVVP